MKTYEVIQGDTTLNLSFSVDGYATLDANWSCDIEVLELIDGSVQPEIDRAAVKNGGSTAFDVYLTPTETGTLTAGQTYYWIVRMTNTTLTPSYSRTTINQLKVAHKG